MTEFTLIYVDPLRKPNFFSLVDGKISKIESFSGKTLPNIMILPASCALPFEVELPFRDETKVRRVLPQFVADVFPSVTDDWIFSWKCTRKGGGETSSETPANELTESYTITGLAFPTEFSPSLLFPDVEFRLAVPDAFLVNSTKNPAIVLKTPVDESFIIYSEENAVRRVFRTDSELPLESFAVSEGFAEIIRTDLHQDPASLHTRIEFLLSSSESFDCCGLLWNSRQESLSALDLSNWAKRRSSRMIKYIAGASVLIIFFWVMLAHYFTWFECSLTEKAAKRTASNISREFTKHFPGVPVVEPVVQIDKVLLQAEKASKDSEALPEIPWILFLKAVSELTDEISISKISAKPTGFKISGTAGTFSSLESFRKQIGDCREIRETSITESKQSGSLVMFTLDGHWSR